MQNQPPRLPLCCGSGRPKIQGFPLEQKLSANIKLVKLGGEGTSGAAAYKQSGDWKKSKARLRTGLNQLVSSKARVKRASQNWSKQLVAVNPEKQEEHSLTHSVAAAEAWRVSETALLLHPQRQKI